MNKLCRICHSGQIDTLLDCGLQPISNRYLATCEESEDLRPMVVGQCMVCATVQLIQPASAEDVRPRFSWITYKEPETHLDDMVQHLTAVPEVTAGCKVLGLSFKDDSVLERLGRLGHLTQRLSIDTDLGIQSEGAGLESIQQALTPARAKELASRLGRFPLIIARHIFEHTDNTRDFLGAVRELTTPDGVIVFEVPDSFRALSAPDYTVIWEEHVLMLTPKTFVRAATFGGFTPVWFHEYPYPNENSMVLFVRSGGNQAPAFPTSAELDEELALGHRFAGLFSQTRQSIREFFERNGGPPKKIALFGAGHNACVFLNILGLAEHIAFVADDHPGKVGLFMPGSKVPIQKSENLMTDGITLSLSSLSHESENVVLKKCPAFRDGRVAYRSIYPASRHFFLQKTQDETSERDS